MKRKRLDRDIWTRITSKRYIQRIMKNNDFEGIVSLLYFDNVSSPFIKDNITICDQGMKWLQFIPCNENYLITAMFNEENEINTWYIDIIADHGYTDDHVVYIDDLYLDLIVHPNGDIKLDDLDELEEALNQKTISEDLYLQALQTKDKLLKGILSNIPKFYQFCIKLLQEIESLQ